MRYLPFPGAKQNPRRTFLTLVLTGLTGLLAPWACALAEPAGGGDGETVRIFRVFSGDAVLVRQRGHTWRARIDGIEAPDPATPEGEASRVILEKMVGSRRVQVRVLGEEPDGYRRVRMQFDKWDIGEEMARAGAVWVRSTDPALTAAQAEAREKGLGLWAQGSP
jgi:endonuclease YncB( thermonuclease family)